MNLRCQTITVIALVLAATMPLHGQNRDSRDRDSRDRESRDRGRESFDVEKFLQRLDDNANGLIEPSEVNRDKTRRFLESSGADLSKPFKIKSFMKKLNKKKAEKEASASRAAQRSLGFSVVEEERDASTGDSPRFTILKEEREPDEQARRTEFDPAAVKMTEWVLGKYDRDGDGKIDSEEMKSGRFADPPASESDTNGDGNLSRSELLIRYQNREDGKNKAAGGGGGRGDKEDRDDSDRDRFDRGRGGDRGRGDRERSRFDRSSSESNDKREESTDTGSAGQRDVRKGYETYVDGIFKSYDKNTDGFLDSDELSKMRRKPSKTADTDGDSKISKSELVEAYLVKAGKSKRGSTKPSSSSSSGSSKSTTASSTVSRFQLTKKDANENGQIEMAEYESAWTNEKIAEFYEIDANGDGVITKAEWEAK